jgi:hypothetical protein
MTPGFGLVIMLACAVFYYRLGEAEYGGGLLLGAASLALWLAGAYFLHFGLLGCLLVQACPFIGLTIWNMTRKL